MPIIRLLSCCCMAALAFAVAGAIKAPGSDLDDVFISEDAGVFLAALKAAGITIKAKSAWTILAPTDAAFAARLNASPGISQAELLQHNNSDTLEQVLLYHIIPSGSFLSSELEDCQQLPTRLTESPPLTARLTKPKVFATTSGNTGIKPGLQFEGVSNTARVVKPDIEAGNSVVHVVDAVLLPRGVGKGAVLPYYPSFESVLTGAKLSTMMAALQASGITLSPERRYTILAPTDAAFASRLSKSLRMQPADLLAPAEASQLQKILSYHIIPSSTLLTSHLKGGQAVRTSLPGAAPLTVQLNCGKVAFAGEGGSARVTAADVRAGRDIVVHVVDDVLLPAV